MKLTLAVLPTALFAGSFFLANHHGPYFLRNNFDPDYDYLLNSLSLLKWRTPGHTDHPGTTLQLLGAVVVWFQWLGAWLGHRQPLTESVLAHPEEYLRGINIVLNALIGMTLYWAAWTIYRLSNSLAAGLVLQGSVLVYSQTFLALPRVSPEPLLIATGLALMALLAPMVLRRDDSHANEDSLASAAGAMFGFGLVTKVTFAPWAAMILLFPKISQRRRFMMAAMAATVILLLPVTARLSDMASWFTSLLTHSGHYGTGRVGIPATSVLAANLVSLWQVEPPLFWFLGLYVTVLCMLPLLRQRGLPIPDTTRPLLLAACSTIVIEVVLVVKHPAFHYLLPALVLTAFVNSALWILLPHPMLGALLQARQLSRIAILALIGLGLTRNWSSFRWWMDATQTDRQNIAQLHAIEEGSPGCIVIGSYRSSLKLYALSFASGYSAMVHASALDKVYPGTINYDPFHDRFWNFAFHEKDAEVKQLVINGQCVLLESTPLDGSSLKRFLVNDGISFVTVMSAANPIIPSDSTSLYRLQASGRP